MTAPVLLYAGELDPFVTADAVRAAAANFADAAVVVQPQAFCTGGKWRLPAGE